MSTSKRYFTKTATAQAAAPQPKARKPRVTKAEVEDATVVNESVVDDGDPINPAPGSEGAKQHSAYQRMTAAADEFMETMGVDQWKRELVNFTAGLFGYGATLYLGVQITNVLCSAVLMYVGVGFISFMVAFLGMCAAFFAAFAAGQLIYRFAAAFDYENAKSRVTSFFGRNTAEVSHA